MEGRESGRANGRARRNVRESGGQIVFVFSHRKRIYLKGEGEVRNCLPSFLRTNKCSNFAPLS